MRDAMNVASSNENLLAGDSYNFAIREERCQGFNRFLVRLLVAVLRDNHGLVGNIEIRIGASHSFPHFSRRDDPIEMFESFDFFFGVKLNNGIKDVCTVTNKVSE